MSIRTMVLSPLHGDTDLHVQYALACCEDCIDLGESPFASHLFYPQFLDDDDPESRQVGMRCGQEWMRVANQVAVYSDFGVSTGMQEDLKLARRLGLRIVYRNLPEDRIKTILGVN